MAYTLPTQRKKELGKARIVAFFEAPITGTYTAEEVAKHLHANPGIVQSLITELVTEGILTEIP